MKRVFWVHLVKDVRLLFADPLALLLSLAIPLVLGGLMSIAFGGAGDVQPKAQVWLADEDESFLSEVLVNALGSEDVPIELSLASWPDAQAALEAGEGSVALRLPAGFGQQFLLEQPLTIDVITNPSQTILPGIVTNLLELLREAHFYLHRLFGAPLKLIAAGPPPDDSLFANTQVAALAVQINTLMQDVEERLFPPQIELEELSAAEKSSFDRPLTQLLIPGVLVMTLLFLAQGFAEQLWREREVPTLRRILTAPHGLRDFLFSKTLSATLMISAISALCLALGGLLLGLEWAHLPAVWLLATLVGAAFYLLFAFLGTFASNQRGANLIANMLLFPLIMIGGSFFPLETMPDGLAMLGRLTPNGSAVATIDALLAGAPAPWTATLVIIGITGLLSGVGFVWGLSRGVRG